MVGKSWHVCVLSFYVLEDIQGVAMMLPEWNIIYIWIVHLFLHEYMKTLRCRWVIELCMMWNEWYRNDVIRGQERMGTNIINCEWNIGVCWDRHREKWREIVFLNLLYFFWEFVIFVVVLSYEFVIFLLRICYISLVNLLYLVSFSLENLLYLLSFFIYRF